MDQNLALWLVAQVIAIGLTGMGTLMMVHRNLVAKIEASANDLHTRVNETRDKYVRRDDLDGHLNGMQRQIERMDAKLDRILERQSPHNG